MKRFIDNRIFALLTLSIMIVACSSTPEDTYLASQSRAALQIPPNLTQPVSNPEYDIPGISSQLTTYSGYSSAENQKKEVLPEIGKDAVFKRDGNVFWVEIDKSPNELWPIVRNFIGRAGFEIKYANQTTGTMDTSWRVNEDGASWMASMTSGDQGTYMDKFRIRLERGKDKNHTRLFIRHKGARIAKDVVNKDIWENEDPLAVYDDDSGKTIWVSRPSDPELEIEMLQNFLVYYGIDKDAVDAELSVYSNKQIARLISLDKGMALQVNENFPRTWRRIGLALDRMGFIVDDRNRSAGVYYISLPDKFETKEEKTWFERLLNKDQSELPSSYLLSIVGKGDKTTVTIRNRESSVLDKEVAEKILRKIQAHIS